MERNVDKIKRLEHELGKYRKKVEDQGKKIKELLETVEGDREAMLALDANMIQLALSYGQEEVEDGEVLGWRLEYPKVEVHKLLEEYQVKARIDQKTQQMVIGVMKRE